MAPSIRSRKLSFPFIHKLPGEIRNQVYACCIDNARIAATKNSAGIRLATPTTSTIDVTVFPRWNGHPSLQLSGLRGLPMIFVSKQIYQELLTLIYSRVDNVCLGGYILQPYIDTSQRWKEAYSILQRQPGLLKFARKITIKLPSERADLERGYWNSMGYRGSSTPSTGPLLENCPTAWQVLPGLQDFLRKFDALPKIRLLVSVQLNVKPDFAPLLSLYIMDTIEASVEFVDQFYHKSPDESVLRWVAAWDVYLQERETANLEKALETRRV